MTQGLIFVVATVMVYLAPGVHGTSHLMFANNTQINITRAGCGVTKLCVETPADCDPTVNGSCLFASMRPDTPMAPNGVNLYVGLRGESSGYIALVLAPNSSMGTAMVFLCGNQVNPNNSRIFFRTLNMQLNDSALTPSETPVKMIRGVVNGAVIQCEFMVPGVNATAPSRMSQDTTFLVSLATGALTATANTIGPLTLFNSGIQNVADPASNLNNTMLPGGGASTAAPGGGASTAAPGGGASTAAPGGGASTAAPGSGASSVFQHHAAPVLLGVLVCLFSLRT